MAKKNSYSFSWYPSTYEETRQLIRNPILIPHIRNAIRLGFPVTCPPPLDDPNGNYDVQDKNGVLEIVRAS